MNFVAKSISMLIRVFHADRHLAGQVHYMCKSEMFHRGACLVVLCALPKPGAEMVMNPHCQFESGALLFQPHAFDDAHLIQLLLRPLSPCAVDIVLVFPSKDDRVSAND